MATKRGRPDDYYDDRSPAHMCIEFKVQYSSRAPKRRRAPRPGPRDYSSSMDEEEGAIGILKEIEDNASNEEIEHALYEFRGVLSKAVSRVGEGPLVSCYLLLRESPEYHTFALSLSHFIIEDVRACRHDLLKQIHDILQSKRLQQSEKQVPKLMLRCTLSAIANQLDQGQIEEFVTLTAETHLKVHPDRFGNSQRMLKVFEMMESRHLLDDKLALVRNTLQLIRRPDVIEKIIDRYDPNKSISVIMTKDTKCKFQYFKA